MALHEWIKAVYLDDKKILQLQRRFQKARPFEHLALPNFFVEEKIADVLIALSSESFERKESDLFACSQTKDLASSQSKTLVAFRAFLCSDEFTSYLESLTGVDIKAGVIDMAGTIYGDTDHLLCHDDKLEGRSIAYMIYFTSLKKKDGGALCLYESRNGRPTRIVKRIMPQANMFAFFKVAPVSFHQVDEVLQDVQRIAISGWFHG